MPNGSHSARAGQPLCYYAAVWWFVFTAIDLYVGVVLLDTLARSDTIPAEKRQRLLRAKQITLALLALTIVGLLLKLVASKWM